MLSGPLVVGYRYKRKSETMRVGNTLSAFEKVSGPPAVKFTNIGDSVAGLIISTLDYQEKIFGTEDLRVYPKTGDPVMGVQIVLETRPGDESSRVTLYAQGKLLMAAIAGAFRAAGRSDITIGDELAVSHNGMAGRAKTYVADYYKAEPAATAE